jgi:SAM-dependent methyltransferase
MTRSPWLRAALMVGVLAGCTAGRTGSVVTPTTTSSTGGAPAVAMDRAASAPAADSTDEAPAASVSRPHVDVIYWATPQPVVDKMLELAGTRASDVVYDLGCGDARSLVTAAQRYGARGFGFDVDPQRVREAQENVRQHGVENLVTIQQADIFQLDLSPADVVFLFLLPRLNERLKPQLAKLRPGTRIVSHEFELPGAVPNRVMRVPGPPDGPPDTDPSVKKLHTLYLWKMPWRTDKAPKGDSRSPDW